MKTIPLRLLVREPLKVKRWTRAGQTVQVTDNGKLLWTIAGVLATGNESRRRQDLDELLDEVLHEPRGRTSAARLLDESRR
jgi:hypothetical protein